MAADNPPRRPATTLYPSAKAPGGYTHIANITAKAAGRCRVLSSQTSKQWGWGKDQLTKIYKALYLSVLMYGAPTWQPWLSATRLEQLERCQNRALRVITGQLQTTPVGTLRQEAGVCNMTTLMRRQTAIANAITVRLAQAISRLDAHSASFPQELCTEFLE